MGCDLAVCFLQEPISPATVAAAIAFDQKDDHEIYLASGIGPQSVGGVAYFCLWASRDLDLPEVCRRLSATHSSPICLVWKSEHGGVAGYLSFDHGLETENVADDSDEYLLIPSIGFEKVLDIELNLSDFERMIFPEFVLDSCNECAEFDGALGRFVPAPPGTIRRLMEYELDVEPALPIA